MTMFGNKPAIVANQQTTLNKPAGQVFGTKPIGIAAAAVKTPVVAPIPQSEPATTEQVAKTGAKSYVNDLTPETKQSIKERVMQNVEAALSGVEISTMALSHLCFVSPTSIKTHGTDTNSATAVITKQFSGEKRTTSKETKLGSSLASYVAGLDAAGQAEFLKVAVNPVALSQLMKQLNLKA